MSGQTERRSIGDWIDRRFFWLLSALVALFCLWLVLRFPVYFRGDDATYLRWAAEHTSPGAAFDPGQAKLFGSLRPLQNLGWWCLYRLFGLAPLPYQLLLTLLFGFSFVWFGLLAERLFGRAAAVLSLAAYGAVFYFLGYIVFWFSDFTFVWEIFFLNLSLYFLLRAVQQKAVFFIPGIAAYLLAALAKEPAALIVPLVLAAYLWTADRAALPRFRRSVLITAALLAGGVLWLALNPYVQARQVVDLSLGATKLFNYTAMRWRFYAAYLTPGLGVLFFFASYYLAGVSLSAGRDTRRSKGFYWSLAAAAIMALALRFFPSWALWGFFAALAVMLCRRHRAVAGAVWFGVPFFGLITIGFMVRTYLLEISFGAALVIGVALADVLDRLEWRRVIRESRAVKAAAVLGAIVLLLVAAFGAPKVKGKLGALQVVSDARHNFRAAVDHLAANAELENADLVVVDYDDMGLSYTRDILRLPDRRKAHRQKTMTSEDLQNFLMVRGLPAVRVRNLAWLKKQASPTGAVIFAMNRAEREFLESQNWPLQPVFAVSRGDEGAWLYHTSEPESRAGH